MKSIDMWCPVSPCRRTVHQDFENVPSHFSCNSKDKLFSLHFPWIKSCEATDIQTLIRCANHYFLDTKKFPLSNPLTRIRNKTSTSCSRIKFHAQPLQLPKILQKKNRKKGSTRSTSRLRENVLPIQIVCTCWNICYPKLFANRWNCCQYQFKHMKLKRIKDAKRKDMKARRRGITNWMVTREEVLRLQPRLTVGYIMPDVHIPVCEI